MQWADSLEKTLPDAGKDWRQKEKRATEDEILGWHHWFNGHELGQTPGDGDGQGGLACYSPWGRQELGMTWRLNNNHLWILDIVNFTFWGAGYFIPKNLLELFTGKHLSCLEAVWSSVVLLLWFVRWVHQSSAQVGADYSSLLRRDLLGILCRASWTMTFFSPAGGNQYWSQSCVGSEHCSL